MKGVIADCLSKLVVDNFGSKKWIEVLREVGFSEYTIFLPFQDIKDDKIIQLIGATCKVTGITMKQAVDAFGEYWVNIYAADMYKIYYMDCENVKDFLLKMDQVHEKVTRRVENAEPPRFSYHWKNDNVLIMGYKSKRAMIDILHGLVKGVGKYYNETIVVNKLNEKELEIVFP
ncbi:MAG: heme NO-binding domain-containing protein [Desulfobulbaceae bacterium]|nr:heme NO-binding domain-containing protein [Desulfobulbaceae bacterium]